MPVLLGFTHDFSCPSCFPGSLLKNQFKAFLLFHRLCNSLIGQLTSVLFLLQSACSPAHNFQWFSSLPSEFSYILYYNFWASLVAQTVKNPPVIWETWVQSPGWEDPLEEVMATHSSILAWRIPWTEEPGSLQSMESQRVGHFLAHTQEEERIGKCWI